MFWQLGLNPRRAIINCLPLNSTLKGHFTTCCPLPFHPTVMSKSGSLIQSAIQTKRVCSSRKRPCYLCHQSINFYINNGSNGYVLCERGQSQWWTHRELSLDSTHSFSIFTANSFCFTFCRFALVRFGSLSPLILSVFFPMATGGCFQPTNSVRYLH